MTPKKTRPLEGNAGGTREGFPEESDERKWKLDKSMKEIQAAGQHVHRLHVVTSQQMHATVFSRVVGRS